MRTLFRANGHCLWDNVTFFASCLYWTKSPFIALISLLIGSTMSFFFIVRLYFTACRHCNLNSSIFFVSNPVADPAPRRCSCTIPLRLRKWYIAWPRRHLPRVPSPWVNVILVRHVTWLFPYGSRRWLLMFYRRAGATS
ncbi:hypothetical protein AAHE18_12G085800 [Arachis hypogaea]